MITQRKEVIGVYLRLALTAAALHHPSKLLISQTLITAEQSDVSAQRGSPTEFKQTKRHHIQY